MAQATFINGEPLMVEYTPSGSDVTGGDVIVTNGIVRIAHADIDDGDLGHLACGGGLYDVTADAAIAVGKRVYWDDSANKVTETAGTNKRFGYCVEASSADGDVIQCIHQPGPSAVRQVISFPVDLASITGAGDVVTTYTPGFAGKIVKLDAVVNVPVTTAAKAASINAEIGTTNLTGGVVALTSANCTPMGAVIAGSAVTAANSFTATDTISLEAASVTAFAEGSVTIMMVVEVAND